MFWIIIVLLVVILLIIWKLGIIENYVHAPTKYLAWMGVPTVDNGVVYENYTLQPVIQKMKDAGMALTNTLQRRLGSENAGSQKEQLRTNSCIGTFDCFYDNFTQKNDIAAGTMYAGYYNNASLPA